MKALLKTTGKVDQTLSTPFLIKKNDTDIKIIDFQKMHKNYLLQLGVSNISKDNYRIFIKGFYLTLILSEPKEINRPIRVHNMNWSIYSQRSYELMRNIDIWLPGDNFYLIKHYSVPEEELLKIILCKVHKN